MSFQRIVLEIKQFVHCRCIDLYKETNVLANGASTAQNRGITWFFYWHTFIGNCVKIQLYENIYV